MMADWLEPFRLLVCASEKDGTGSLRETWTEGDAFRAAVTGVKAAETEPGSRPSLRLTGTLLHDGSTAPGFRDRVLRVRDGSVWQVCGMEERMPFSAEETGAAVPVESVVKPL